MIYLKYIKIDAHFFLVTFFNTTNPYLEPGTPDPDGQGSSPHRTSYSQLRDQWSFDQPQDQQSGTPSGLHSRGLEALSAAALYSPPEANMLPRPLSNHRNQFDTTFDHVSPNQDINQHTTSPDTATSSGNNLDFLLNPTSVTDPSIDPSLMSSGAHPHSSQSGEPVAPQRPMNGKSADGEAESEQKVAYLLRHFSESPGSWCVK